MAEDGIIGEYREKARSYVDEYIHERVTFERLRKNVLLMEKAPSWAQFYRNKVMDCSEEKNHALRVALERGTCVIDDPKLLFAYLFWNAPKITNKLERTFRAFDREQPLSEIVEGDFAVTDWSCGQGIGTMCLLDFVLPKRGYVRPLPSEVILVEPSELALDNAAFHLSLYGIDEVKPIAKYFGEIDEEEVKVRSARTIHILSHIIDLLDEAELKQLAHLIVSSSSGEHSILCASSTHSTRDVPTCFCTFEAALADEVAQEGGQRNMKVLATTADDMKISEQDDDMELLIIKIKS